MQANDIEAFFDPSDGMTVPGVIAGTVIAIDGYLDAFIIDFNLDDSGPSDERYTFICAMFDEWSSVVGKFMTVSGAGNYRITKSEPDGTGLLTLHLFCED